MASRAGREQLGDLRTLFEGREVNTLDVGKCMDETKLGGLVVLGWRKYPQHGLLAALKRLRRPMADPGD